MTSLRTLRWRESYYSTRDPYLFDRANQISKPAAPRTFRSSVVKIASGRWDMGASHRAIHIARELFDAALWDGQTEISIHDPYALHRQVFGIQRRPITDLKPDLDYVIWSTTVKPPAPKPAPILCLPAPAQPIALLPAPAQPIALLPAPKQSPTKYKIGDVLRVPRSSWQCEIVRIEVMPTTTYYGFKTGMSSTGKHFTLMCSEQAVIAAQSPAYRA